MNLNKVKKIPKCLWVYIFFVIILLMNYIALDNANSNERGNNVALLFCFILPLFGAFFCKIYSDIKKKINHSKNEK